MFALEFARLVAARDDALGGEPLAMPSSLRELVRERVAGFPAEIRPLLEFVATLERPTLAIIGRAFEADENLLAVAERAGALTVGDDGIVRFAHPLIASSAITRRHRSAGGRCTRRRRALSRIRRRARGISRSQPSAPMPGSRRCWTRLRGEHLYEDCPTRPPSLLNGRLC